MIEYVLWGIPPNKSQEELLIANIEGKPVTKKDVAKQLKIVLETKYKCTNVRIQTIDFSEGLAFNKPLTLLNL